MGPTTAKKNKHFRGLTRIKINIMATNAKAVPKVNMVFTKDYLHYKKDQVVKANKQMAEYWEKIKVAKKK